LGGFAAQPNPYSCVDHRMKIWMNRGALEECWGRGWVVTAGGRSGPEDWGQWGQGNWDHGSGQAFQDETRIGLGQESPAARDSLVPTGLKKPIPCHTL
ncbi:MAG: hypothetical protein ACO4CG_04665, partial [Prochlorothrix sp.]